MEKGISVVICCYNSASRLPETIRYLAAQKKSVEVKWEIIIVDNASTDNTSAVALEEWERNKSDNTNFVVIPQPLKGLSNARAIGLTTAKYDKILFCDDDNHLEENYIQISSELMDAMPEVAILGGEGKPKFPYQPGNWIKDLYPAMAIGPQAVRDGYVNWVYGAGMVIRKKVYEELRARNIKIILSDRTGKKQLSGGDAEMCTSVRFLGHKLYYTSRLTFYHCMPAHRLKKSFFLKANFLIAFPVIYLHILNQYVDGNRNINKMYWSYFKEKIRHTFYFLPRMIVGKHQFYSLTMVYQNIQLIGWLLFRRKMFNDTCRRISENLSLASKSGL